MVHEPVASGLTGAWRVAVSPLAYSTRTGPTSDRSELPALTSSGCPPPSPSPMPARRSVSSPASLKTVRSSSGSTVGVWFQDGTARTLKVVSAISPSSNTTVTVALPAPWAVKESVA